LFSTVARRADNRAIAACALLISFAGISCCAALAQMTIQSTITTVAGSGTACSASTSACGDGDAATSANLNNPQHVTVDSAGNLYISDNSDNRVRKVSASTGDITTVAGNGTQCSSPTASCGDGGAATSANLYYPNAVVVDAAGDLYIADRKDNRIRKVAFATGYITTVAGNGTACANSTSACGDGGAATSANLNQPIDLALDGAGNLYIADYGDYRIRRVAAGTGIISTVAGTGTYCSSPTASCGDGGPATSANLTYVRGIAFDSAGNGYISDYADERIRKVSATTGYITTVAGNGTQCASPTAGCGDGGAATSANLLDPANLAVDAAGNIYISDYGDGRVRRVNGATGIITTFAGSGTACGTPTGSCGDGGAAASAEFSGVAGVAFDRIGNLYLADSWDNRIRKVTASGIAFSLPQTPIASSSATQDLSLITTATETITSFTVATSQGASQEFTLGAVTGCAVGSNNGIGATCVLPVTFTPAYPGSRSVPLQIVTSTGNISFALTGIGTGPLAALTPGVISTSAGTGTACASPTGNPACGDTGAATSATLNSPQSAFVDSQGNVWVADTSDNRIRRFTPGGVISTVAGTGTACASPTSTCGDGSAATSAELNNPTGVYVDGSGNLYIADWGDNRIRKVWAGTQIITTIAGTGTACASPTSTCGDGAAATSANLNAPSKLAMDGDGNLYIADRGDNRIRMVAASTGFVTTVAGSGTACAASTDNCGDGASALLASLTSPRGIFVDSANNLYIADSSDNRVRKVQAFNSNSGPGYITTVAGTGTACSPSTSSCGDGGAATAAQLNAPRELFVDSAGNLFIADTGDNRIRKVSAGSGDIATVAGNGNAGYVADLVAATGTDLNQPTGFSLDSAGNLYIADMANNRVRAVAVSQSALTYPTNTAVGASDATDDPQSARLSNIGNSNLIIAPPSSGSNPSVSSYFSLDAATTCPELTPSSGPGSLGSGEDCIYAVDFEPTITGSVSGSIILTNNSLAVTGSEQVINMSGTAVAAATTTTLSSSANPSTFSASVTITATVAPTAGTGLPLGTVQFKVNGVSTGSPVTLNSSGQASFTTTALATGTDTITAIYSSTSGDFTGSTSPNLNQVVNKASSSSTITWPAPASISYGTALSATQLDATSSLPGTFVYSPSLGTVLGIGSHTLSVTFTPTDTTDYSTGNASVTLSVGDDTPTVTLALSASTLTHGGALTLTATVSSGGSAVTPGSVTFCDTSYSACLNQAIAGKAQLTSLGVASIKIVPAIGSHTYKAVFAGNSTDSSGTSVTQSVTVSGTYSTTTTISSSGSAGNYSLTGTVVSGASKIVAPSGAVAFVDTSNANYTVASPTLSSSALTQTFTAASSYSTIAVSRDVAVADFNGDGIPDMAVVDQSGEKVYILLGNGDGTFTAASGSPVTVSGSVLVGIAAGDFNDDGNVDLAVTDYYANKVFILLGNGNGTFQTPSSIGVVNEPTEIVTADFNKDGNLDLALVSYSGNEVEVLLGNGSGGFPTTGTFATGSNPYSIAAADLNNDGNMDLVVGNNGASSVTVLLGNGAGSFTQPSGSPFAAGANPSPGGLAIGDFNGDGKPDIAVPDSGSTAVSILLGNGDGTFASPSTLSAQSGQKTIATADFNGDGNLDLATCDTTTGTVDKFLGNGNGTFQAAVSSSTGSTACSSMAVADFNGDGNPDLVIPMQGNNKAVVLLDSVTATATATATGVSIPGTGSHSIQADYQGDSYHTSSTSSTTSLTASAAATVIAFQTSPSSSTYGQQVTLTATLSPYAAGNLSTAGETVTFKAGATTLGTATLSGGVAALTLTTLPTGADSLTASYPGDSNFLTSTSSILSFTVSKATPTITWPTPAAISYGTALSATQLNATSGAVAGTFVYSPAAGAILSAGSQTLGVTFTPTDSTDYTPASGSVTLTVNQATPTLSVASSGNPSTYGNQTTFTATISSGPVGTITFYDNGNTIGSGSIGGTTAQFSTSALTAGSHAITAGFAGNANYIAVTSIAITQVVNKATPALAWVTPSPITYGMALSSTQLDATSGGVAGTFVYSPASGTVLGVGSQTLSVTFNPTDTGDYNSATASVTLTVNDKITPTISWSAPAAITYGTALSAAQLNATSGGVSGTFVYSPAAGTVLNAGTQVLTVTFTPSDTTDYNAVIESVYLTVNKSPVTVGVTSSLDPSAFGDNVTLTFTFAGPGATPTGTTTIMDGSTVLATIEITGGVAIFSTAVLPAEVHTLKAIYNGDDNYE